MPVLMHLVQCYLMIDGSELSFPWVGAQLGLHINLQELLAVVRVFEACLELSN
jgi:hypothetical protein